MEGSRDEEQEEQREHQDEQEEGGGARDESPIARGMDAAPRTQRREPDRMRLVRRTIAPPVHNCPLAVFLRLAAMGFLSACELTSAPPS